MHVEAGHNHSAPDDILKDLRCPLCLYHTKHKSNMIDHIVLHRGTHRKHHAKWNVGRLHFWRNSPAFWEMCMFVLLQRVWWEGWAWKQAGGFLGLCVASPRLAGLIESGPVNLTESYVAKCWLHRPTKLQLRQHSAKFQRLIKHIFWLVDKLNTVFWQHWHTVCVPS